MKKLIFALFGVVVFGLLSANPAGKNYSPKVGFTNSLSAPSASDGLLLQDGGNFLLQDGGRLIF